MGWSSFQVMAIVRLPVWLTYRTGPRKTYGRAPNSPSSVSRQNSSTRLPSRTWLM